MLEKIGIIGLGLIGGSLAKALKNRMHTKTIVAANRSEDVLMAAYNEGIVDQYATDVTDIFCGCDVVFICTPVDKIFSYAQKLTQYVSANCIVSDVGSTKGHIYDQMKSLNNKFFFIGGHPMTGSEKFRYNAAKEHLFENAYYILTPDDNVPQTMVDEFEQTISAIGAIPIVVSPYQHDYIVASISHVPHIIASALCNSVKNMDTEKKHMQLLAAGGFKDITRIASSSPDMWSSICFDNKKEIVNALDNLESMISGIKASILADDGKAVYNYFNNARLYRDEFSNVNPGSFVKRYEIVIDVLDKPGSIAIIAVLFSSNNINIKNMSIVNNREQECGVLQIAFDSEEQRQKSVALLREMNYEVHIKI